MVSARLTKPLSRYALPIDFADFRTFLPKTQLYRLQILPYYGCKMTGFSVYRNQFWIILAQLPKSGLSPYKPTQFTTLCLKRPPLPEFRDELRCREGQIPEAGNIAVYWHSGKPLIHLGSVPDGTTDGLKGWRVVPGRAGSGIGAKTLLSFSLADNCQHK